MGNKEGQGRFRRALERASSVLRRKTTQEPQATEEVITPRFGIETGNDLGAVAEVFRAPRVYAESTDTQISLTKEGMEASSDYTIVTRGSVSFLADKSGNIVSKGYHEFKVFTVTTEQGAELKGIIGETGALKYALKPPTEDNSMFEPSKEGFHDMEYRGDLGGVFVTRTGATSTIVDGEGRSITNEYHEIFSRDNKLYGKVGAREEEIQFRPQVEESSSRSGTVTPDEIDDAPPVALKGRGSELVRKRKELGVGGVDISARVRDVVRSRPVLSDSEKLEFELRGLEHRELGRHQAEQGIIPQNAGNAGFYLDEQTGALTFGDPKDPRNWLEITMDSQEGALKSEGADEHPLIIASRHNIDPNQRWDDLGMFMVDGLRAAGAYLARRNQTTLTDTLDTLDASRQWTGKPAPTDKEGLKDFWRHAYMQGIGTFHLDKLASQQSGTNACNPSPGTFHLDKLAFQQDQGIGNADEVRRQVDAVTINLTLDPVSVLNSLNAARLYASERPIERANIVYRPKLKSEDLNAYTQSALEVLASDHVLERPYATWALLAQASLERSGTSLTAPLTATIDKEGDGSSVKDDGKGTLQKLDEINELVGEVVGKEWDGWEKGLQHFDLEDAAGRISGALEYGKTAFYSSYDDKYREPYKERERKEELVKKVREMVSDLRK